MSTYASDIVVMPAVDGNDDVQSVLQELDASKADNTHAHPEYSASGHLHDPIYVRKTDIYTYDAESRTRIAASDIKNIPDVGVSSEDVQSAIYELASKIGIGFHTHYAQNLTFIPTGNITSQDIQGAITELEAYKASIAHTHSYASVSHNHNSTYAEIAHVHTADDIVTTGYGEFLSATDVQTALQNLSDAINSSSTFSDLVVTDSISGAAIITSSSLTGAADTNVPSSLAIKSYVDNLTSGLNWISTALFFYDPTGSIPGAGDDIRVISTATANGWTENYIYDYADSTWTETIPSSGDALYVSEVNDDDYSAGAYTYNGTDWVKFGSFVQHNNMDGLFGSTDGFHVSSTEYSNISGLNQSVSTTSNVQFANTYISGILKAGSSGGINLTNAAGYLDPYVFQQRSATDGQVLTWISAENRWEPSDRGFLPYEGLEFDSLYFDSTEGVWKNTDTLSITPGSGIGVSGDISISGKIDNPEDDLVLSSVGVVKTENPLEVGASYMSVGGTAGATNPTFRRCSINDDTGVITVTDGPDMMLNGSADNSPDQDFIAQRVWNAVFNDIADFQELCSGEAIHFGKCYYETGEGLALTTKRCQNAVVGVATDTFGFACGAGRDGCVPIAISGWVLAMVDGYYIPGTPLTCNGRGYLTLMSDEEKRNYPERLIAIYMKRETAKEWGPPGKKVAVNDRHWVKVK